MKWVSKSFLRNLCGFQCVHLGFHLNHTISKHLLAFKYELVKSKGVWSGEVSVGPHFATIKALLAAIKRSNVQPLLPGSAFILIEFDRVIY